MTRADFTAPEWRYIQTAIIGTVDYVSLSDENFFGDIKEKWDSKKIIKKYAEENESLFIEELMDLDNYYSPLPKFTRDNSREMEPQILRYISKAVDAIEKRDPSFVPEFKRLITELAQTTAESYQGINKTEASAVKKVINALNTKPDSVVKEWDPKNPFA